MNAEALLKILIVAAICALLAFLASLLLRRRHSVLGYLGAGLLGEQIGGWLAGALKATDWPVKITLSGATVHLLWTFVGALLVLLVCRLLTGRGR